jgi:hypothetical protein
VRLCGVAEWNNSRITFFLSLTPFGDNILITNDSMCHWLSTKEL